MRDRAPGASETSVVRGDAKGVPPGSHTVANTRRTRPILGVDAYRDPGGSPVSTGAAGEGGVYSIGYSVRGLYMDLIHSIAARKRRSSLPRKTGVMVRPFPGPAMVGCG